MACVVHVVRDNIDRSISLGEEIFVPCNFPLSALSPVSRVVAATVVFPIHIDVRSVCGAAERRIFPIAIMAFLE